MICCPDVALDMLVSVSDTVDEKNLSKTEYYFYQILIAEALYKNNLLQTNHSEIINAASYFDSLAEKHSKNVNIVFQNSRAHYYKAVGEIENGDIKDACENYLVSLKTIDDIKNKDRNYEIDYFNGLIYNRLARIYYDFTNDIALKLYDKANECFMKCHADLSLALNCVSIAKILSSDNKIDESEKYLLIADSLIKQNMIDYETATKLKEGILMTRAINMSNSGNQSDEALQIMKELYKNSTDLNTKIIRSAVLGEMFYQNNIPDSALYYYEIAFENNHTAKITVASRIVEIGKLTNDNALIARYALYLAEETNKELEFTPLKAELIAMFKQYEADKHKEEIRHLWIKIIQGLILLIIALMTVFYVVSIIQRRKHIDEIHRKDWYISTLHGKIKKTNAENKKVKENIKLFEDKPDVPTEVKTNQIPFAERLRNVKDNELSKKLLAVTKMPIKTTLLYPELALTDDEKIYLVELFDKEFDGAIHSLINKYSRLKKSDEIILCLSLMGLENKHIAAVTGSSYHNVFVRSQKCLETLGGGEDLHDVLVKTLNIEN